MEQASVQKDYSEQPSESNFLMGAQLQSVKLEPNPIEDAFMEGFFAGVDYIRAINFFDPDEAFEAAWSYKESYLRALKRNEKVDQ